MSFRKSIITTALAILGFTATPSPASADWLFTPFVGTTFNAAANFNDAFEGGDDFEQQFTYGASRTSLMMTMTSSSSTTAM